MAELPKVYVVTLFVACIDDPPLSLIYGRYDMVNYLG